MAVKCAKRTGVTSILAVDVLGQVIIFTPAICVYHIAARKRCWTISNNGETCSLLNEYDMRLCLA